MQISKFGLIFATFALMTACGETPTPANEVQVSASPPSASFSEVMPVQDGVYRADLYDREAVIVVENG